MPDDETRTPEQTDAPAPTDTAPAQTSEADVQEQKQAPEATQEAQDVETPETEVNAEDTAEERLYAGKYKSVEDMEKAYKELQSKSTRDSQEKAELTRILNDAFVSPEPPATTQDSGDYDDYQDDEKPSDPRIEQLVRNDAVTRFAFSHPDADGDAINKVLKEDPMVKQMTGYDAKLEYAYLKSKNMSQSKAVDEAKKVAAQQTQAKIVEKQTAQVESSRKSEPVDEKAELKNRMSTGSLAERERARREYIRKYLV